MKHYFSLFLLISGLSLSCITNAQEKEDRYFEINKNIEIFNAIIKELDLFYVDSIQVEKTIQKGIDNMLSDLDPYTNYIPEKDMDDFKFMTTGDYAGIGSLIVSRKIGDVYRVVVTGPFENMPATKAGLKEGDIILEVDGEDMVETNVTQAASLTEKVSSKLKGQAGTPIKLKIQRPNEKKTRDINITREQIHVSSIPYYGMIKDNIGFISYTSFTDKSAQEFKKALLDLKGQGMEALIIDLRGNGGGILEEAVQMVNFFVPKGEVVLSTKGKLKQTERVYRTTLAPIDTEIPLAVLVDRTSASAAEIVAGALQDMDRAVIVGERTFGKGLVQMPRELPYGGSLKVTTSKYYIPTGRCIQAIDYAHRNEDGSVARIPDSLTTVFKTAHGREVRDGGGIVPDITTTPEKSPSIAYYLVTQYIIFDFATDWVQKHPTIAPAESFTFTEQDYEDFKKYVKNKEDFKYDILSEKTLKSLREVMEYEGYMNTSEEEFKALETKLTPDLDRDLESFKEQISELISLEIVKRYYYQKGEVIESLKNDEGLNEALSVLANSEKYTTILRPSVTEVASIEE